MRNHIFATWDPVNTATDKEKEKENSTSLEIKFETAGSVLHGTKWQEGVVGVVWVCRWANTGLMPVRPVIATLCSIEVPAGHAVEIA